MRVISTNNIHGKDCLLLEEDDVFFIAIRGSKNVREGVCNGIIHRHGFNYTLFEIELGTDINNFVESKIREGVKLNEFVNYPPDLLLISRTLHIAHFTLASTYKNVEILRTKPLTGVTGTYGITLTFGGINVDDDRISHYTRSFRFADYDFDDEVVEWFMKPSDMDMFNRLVKYANGHDQVFEVFYSPTAIMSVEEMGWTVDMGCESSKKHDTVSEALEDMMEILKLKD